MNTTKATKRFSYIVTLDERIDPTYLAIHMSSHNYYNRHLVSVTDLQSNKRVAGSSYRRRQAYATAQTAQKRSLWRDVGKELVSEIKRTF
jgi:hypothetical protein